MPCGIPEKDTHSAGWGGDIEEFVGDLSDDRLFCTCGRVDRYCANPGIEPGMNIRYVKSHLECSYDFNLSNGQFVEFRFEGKVCLSDRVQILCQFYELPVTQIEIVGAF